MDKKLTKNRFIRNIKNEKNDLLTLRKNRKLMIDKILSYSTVLTEGVEKYKEANIKFMIFIGIGVLLNNFMLISVPCCFLSVYFVVRMLKYTKYGGVKRIIKKISKDITFKGIYDKEKINLMIQDFKDKYGDENKEFKELVIDINNYEAFVMKLEYMIRAVKIESKRLQKEKELLRNYKSPAFKDFQEVLSSKKVNEAKENLKYEVKTVEDYDRDSEDSISMIYKNETGEIKKVNRAIEFFEDENSEDYKNTLVLKSNSKNNKNLTVYLYKKESNLQKNAL